jgi:hypothetical protein
VTLRVGAARHPAAARGQGADRRPTPTTATGRRGLVVGPSTATSTGRTARPTTSPGRSGPAARRAKATTCSKERGWKELDRPSRDAGAPALLMAEPKLFLDCDGVLADFDAGRAQAARHRRPHLRGAARQGRVLAAAGARQGLLRTLPKMPDARRAVRRGQAPQADHPHRPSDRQMGGAAEGALGGRAFPRRADHHLHGARQAPPHEAGRRAGRRPRAAPAAWEQAGGIFVHHRSARESLARSYPREGGRRSFRAKGRRLRRGRQVDLLDPLRPEHRLAVRPARRGRRAFADRLQQQPAAVGVEVRQRRAAQKAAGSHGRAAAPSSRS